MSRVLSCRDLMLATSLKNIKNEVELIHPENDAIVINILTQLGFDCKNGIDYAPSLHRDMQNKVAIGYQVVAEMSTDRKYNDYLDAHDRAARAGLTDVSLAKEMCALMGKSYKYNKGSGEQKVVNSKKASRYEDEGNEYSDLYIDDTGDDEYDDYEEADYQANLSQIQTLERLKKEIRGEKE